MDWFVLLTPLLVLPIVLLLVFVGCGVQNTGSGVTRRASVESLGLPAAVFSVEVDFVIKRDDGSTASVPPEPKSFDPAQTPKFEKEFVAGEGDEVSGQCSCRLFVKVVTDPQQSPLHLGPIPHLPTKGMLKWELNSWPSATPPYAADDFSLHPKTT